jgi:hypothetical protein
MTNDTTAVGVQQNARLTGLIAALLIVFLAIEGVTILSIESLMTLHFIIGTLLVAPVLLKVGTTGYKIVRYYTGNAAYVSQGPPPIVRRLLGPVVIVTSLGLLGTGIALALIPKASIDPWVFAHKAFFVLWFIAMTIHVLLHVVATFRAVVFEYFVGRASVLPGWLTRQAVLIVVLIVGIALGAWSMSYSHGWDQFM